MIGNSVFHICEYAKHMEQKGVTYQVEPEILGDKAAWKIGNSKYLAIKTCDNGYQYKFFEDINGKSSDIRSGILDKNISMLEARAKIFEKLGVSP